MISKVKNKQASWLGLYFCVACTCSLSYFTSFNRIQTKTGLDSGWMKHPMVKYCSCLTPWTLRPVREVTRLLCRLVKLNCIIASRWRNMVSYCLFLLPSISIHWMNEARMLTIIFVPSFAQIWRKNKFRWWSICWAGRNQSWSMCKVRKRPFSLTPYALKSPNIAPVWWVNVSFSTTWFSMSI